MSKAKSTQKKEDQKFHSRNIKHDPQAESARKKFGFTDDSPNHTKNRDG